MKKIKLISAHCENFKGFKLADIKFGDKITHIQGCNGLGKSTIAELIMWTLFGVGNDLTSNPKVRREIDRVPVADVPVVGEIIMEVDEKEIIAQKVQKRSIKKDGSYSDDNTYSINGVEKNLKDFKAYFDFSFDDLLMCMNIGAFMAKKSKEMREFLFGLPQNISTKDIVLKYPEFTDLADLMDKYTTEEISSMNKASITKLNKEIAGYPGRIDEVNRQIIEDIDTAELELQKNALLEQIAEIEKLEEDSLSQLRELEEMSRDILELQLKKSDIETAANKTLITQRMEIQKRIDSAAEKLNRVINDYSMAEMNVQRINIAIDRKKKEKSDLIAEFNALNESEYPKHQPLPLLTDADLICPTCEQALPEEKQQEIMRERDEKENLRKTLYEANRQEFYNSKNKKLNDIAASGQKCNEEIAKYESDLILKKEEMEAAAQQKKMANEEKSCAETELEGLPLKADLSENQLYEVLVLEIQKKEEALRSVNTGTDYRAMLKQKKTNIQTELDGVKNQISRAMKNAELEERIDYLRNEHAQKEQAKANCEKILDLLDSLDRQKNELLVNDVNSHFGGRVTWDLFAYAKNGNYKTDYCIPRIDGFTIHDNTANHGRRIEAMLIIALSIQKIIGIQAPIILDDGESLDPWKLPQCDSQIIIMSRTDDKTLKVEKV